MYFILLILTLFDFQYYKYSSQSTNFTQNYHIKMNNNIIEISKNLEQYIENQFNSKFPLNLYEPIKYIMNINNMYLPIFILHQLIFFLLNNVILFDRGFLRSRMHISKIRSTRAIIATAWNCSS